MDEKDKELEALEGAPLARVPLTEADLEEWRHRIDQHNLCVRGWCSMDVTAEELAPLLAEVKAARAWRKEAERALGVFEALYVKLLKADWPDFDDQMDDAKAALLAVGRLRDR